MIWDNPDCKCFFPGYINIWVRWVWGKRGILYLKHGLSQQGVWVPFWTPKPIKRTPQDTQIILCGFSKNLNLKLIIDFSHLLIIPMTLFNDILPYFDEVIHVYGWNMCILWSPLKIWTPKDFTTANFRHPVSKSWLRHWFEILRSLSTLRPRDPAMHSISATTPVLFHGIFWWVTSLNVSHWSKGVMHVVIFTINNDVALTSFSQCTSTGGRLTDWPIQDFSLHFLMSYRK